MINIIWCVYPIQHEKTTERIELSGDEAAAESEYSLLLLGRSPKRDPVVGEGC